MIKLKQKIFLFIPLLLSVFLGFSQSKIDQIEIKSAKKLKGGTFEGKKVNKLIGNVKLKHHKTVMWSDSAYFIDKENRLIGFGHVRVKSDKMTVTGDYLDYDGKTKVAIVRKNVRLVDGKDMTLTTDNLNYAFSSGVASYFGGGTVREKQTTLISKKGTFYRFSGVYHFKNDVVLTKNNQTLKTDTLKYVTADKKAFFYGPTYITAPGKNLYAESGTYNTENEEAAFKTNAYIKTPDYYLEGDSIFFDNTNDYGYAKTNVFLESFKDSVNIIGDEMFRWGKEFKSKVIGDPVMRQISNGDTTYLKGDTLISIQDTVKNSSKIHAYKNVSFFMNDLEGSCDSMAYATTDSIINFYQNPIIWSGQSQITADTIYVTLCDTGVKNMYANINAFVISEDSTKTEYNQVKGKYLTGFFAGSQLSRVDVDGNGESIYYAKDDEGVLMGINKIVCGEMNIFFQENEVDDIIFITTPDANFIPPQQIKSGEDRLSEFKWHIDQKPNKVAIISSFNNNRKKKTTFDNE